MRQRFNGGDALVNGYNDLPFGLIRKDEGKTLLNVGEWNRHGFLAQTAMIAPWHDGLELSV